jgi:DNA repair protein RecO (recombination protein O)
MALISTPAVILHAFPYSESSKIVRLLTREHGVVSAIAKGASRPRSKFGAKLQILSEGTAQLYLKPHRDLQTLSEFDVTAQHPELAGEVRRFAGAAALAELLMRFCPAEPHPELYRLAVEGLRELGTVEHDRLDAATLGVLWAAVGALGFAPRSDACARDGQVLPRGAVAFSIVDGGFLCVTCAKSVAATVLATSDRETLEQLMAGHPEKVGRLSEKHAAAHRRLLVRFVERHVAEGKELKALSVWQELVS